MNTLCPSCGSANIITRNSEKTVTAPMGAAVPYEAAENECPDCGFTGDFSHRNDKAIEKAWKESINISVTKMLTDILSGTISQSYFERALRLPPKTVSRWKRGELSASSVALLRIIHTYDWILDVSDNNFHQGIAASKLISEALRRMTDLVNSAPSHPSVKLKIEATTEYGQMLFETKEKNMPVMEVQYADY